MRQSSPSAFRLGRHAVSLRLRRPAPIRLAVLAVIAGCVSPANAVDLIWSTGSYLAAVGLNPIAVGSTVTGTSNGLKNFESIALVNDGGLIWQSTSRLGFISASLTNNSLLDLQTDANLTYVGGGASTITNNNTFRKSGGAGNSVVGSNITFQNNGIIDAQSGTIDFAGGGANFNGGTQFIGAGVNRVSANAAFNGALLSSNLLLAGGSFTGTAAVISGTVGWTGGQFGGNWQLGANQSLNASDGSSKNFSSAAFTNNGTVNWQTTDQMGFVSSTINNNNLVDLQANANLTYTGGGASSFNNNAGGIFRKSAGAGSSVIGSNITFNNLGTIEAQSGTLDFAGGSAAFGNGTQFLGLGINQVSSNASFNGAITSGNLRLSGGFFNGIGTGGAMLNGAAVWSGGQFTGQWTLPAGQAISATSADAKNFSAASFLNQGTIHWQVPSRIGFLSSTFTNQGLLDLQADTDLTYVGGGASNFINSGTLRKSAGAGTSTISSNVLVSNSGTVDAQMGTIDFAGGNATFMGGTLFTGAGINQISSAAVFGGSFTSSNLLLTGGVFSGAGASGATINGTVRWGGGQFAGTWLLPAGQTLNATGNGNRNFSSAAFTNNGVINWQTTDRVGFLSSTFTNNGLVDIQADANLTYVGGGASTFVNAAGGTLRKSAGAGSTVVSSNITFSNAGIVHADSGTIDFAGGSNTFQPGTRFTGAGVNQTSGAASFNGDFTSSNLVFAGGVQIGNNALLNGTVGWTGGQLQGSWTIGSGQTLNASGSGSKSFNGANVTNNGAINWSTSSGFGLLSSTIQNNGLIDIQQDVNIQYAGGGASNFINAGVLRKSGGAGTTSITSNVAFSNPGTIEALSGTLVLPANFNNTGTISGTARIQTNNLTNSGTIAPGYPLGMLTLEGNLVSTGTGTIDFTLGGLANFDNFTVTGSALLDGSLTIRPFGGYVPTIGDSFTVLNYGSRIGQSEFDAVNPIGFGSGVAFAVAYHAGDATLTVTAVPEPETYALLLAGLGMIGGIAWRRRGID